MKYSDLVRNIEDTHSAFFEQMANAVNQSLTIRNWVIGYYIVEYEQRGNDRAQYGKKLLQTLAEKVNQKGLSYRNLNLYRKFYLVYPEIMQLLTAQSAESQFPILQSLTAEFKSRLKPILASKKRLSINQSKTGNNSYLISLLKKISFTHFVELMAIKDGAKRNFYELVVLEATPSVKELKRQISTLAYERVGLSKTPEIAIKKLQSKIVPAVAQDVVKSHYVLDFLNLANSELVEETELEQALINHLQSFILELGHGFCFESRQKRILIGEKYYFIDLVFYHRVLKCHVLIELKVNDFEHTNASQLNTYLNYYKKEVMLETDNAPVGILMVTNKDKALVEYATAGLDSNLFVSKYMLQLPNQLALETFLKNELKKL